MRPPIHMTSQGRGAFINAARIEQREQFGASSTRSLKVNTVTAIRSPMFAAIRASSLASGAPPARAEWAIHSGVGLRRDLRANE